MTRVSIKAIVIGSIINIGGSFIVGLFFFIVAVAAIMARGVPQKDVMKDVLADRSFFPMHVIIGLSCLAAGSYVAARMARSRELLHAAIVALVGLVVGTLYLLAGNNTSIPSWYYPVLFAFALPVALGAGYVAKRGTQATDRERAA